ncbi:MAG TPA: SIS domain-containing protein [Acidimicrobiales bacterium]|nr:SIS domain-containing protein [Acidimicrobiales bacterium]
MTDFLYPFIEADERDPVPLLADLSRSADAKWTQSTELRTRTLADLDQQLRAAATAMAERFAAGGQLFTFGNGGSATDADGVAQLFTRPPVSAFAGARPLPARSLAADQAILTALSNDIGLDVVFSRQLIAYGRAGDIAFGTSTSGNSDNLLMAFTEARKRGMLTVGLAGYDGGRMAASDDLEHCLVVRSDSVHRIQEAQTSVAHALWAFVQAELRTREEVAV